MSLRVMHCPLCGKEKMGTEEADYWRVDCEECNTGFAIAVWRKEK